MPPYERRYDAMLADLRRGFAKYFADDCAFVDAGISEIWPFYVQLNDIKRAYAEKTPNSIYLDREKSILLITGPNMGGKSTYMRQTAIITLTGAATNPIHIKVLN